MEAVRRELRGSAIALVLVAATTLVAYVLIQSFDVRRGSVIYLLPVLLAGWHLGLLPALVAAVAGVLWSGYFFLSPVLQLLPRPPERDSQSAAVHGGRRGDRATSQTP
jgi:K+-sensing histidine kinase KdpD